VKKNQLALQRAVALLFVGAIFLSIYGAATSPVAAALSRGERVPIVLFGIDAADQSRHTDTLMVSIYDPVHTMLTLLSVPRDTRIDLPGYLFRRVNEIYGYHFRKTSDPVQSSLEVKSAIEHILSSEKAPVVIPYFVQIDFSGFTRMVDLVGGVWVDVKQPMHYDDHAGNLHIHFEPGRTLLGGAEALRYVRFRGHTGDRGRIMRQQDFLRNMARRLANPMMLLKFPQLVAAVASSIRTNLSPWDVVYLSVYARRLRSRGLGFYILPGKPRGPYWTLNKDSVEKISQKIILGEDVAIDDTEIIAPQVQRITVTVWNASGQRGLAYTVTKFLRGCGYDVVDWGNYSTEQLQTRVFDRTGELSKAREVAQSLGVDDFHSEINPKRLVDVEVVLGQNYRGSIDAPQ
jgi:LCP family protein required for cell wall assembly